MRVHISDNPRRVTVVSFPRDLMIPIPSCTREDGSTTSAMSKQQINSAFSYGGLSCVVKTVSELSGQNIPFAARSEEHTSELQSLMRNSYAVFCLQKNTTQTRH